MATEFVRARDPETKHEVSVTRQFAEGYKFEILEDKDAVDADGRPLPSKPHVDLPKADTKTKPQNAGFGQQNGDESR